MQALAHFGSNRAGLYALRHQFCQGLKELEGVSLNGPERDEEAAPHIISTSFKDVRSEVLLHALEERGIYISAGSACSSHKKTASPTLLAIGCGKKEAESSVRFSLCETNRMEEVDETVRVLREMVPLLARYRAR